MMVSKASLTWLAAAALIALALLAGMASCTGPVYAEECGGTSAEAPYSNVDADGDGYGDNVPFSVPTSICFAVGSDGTLIAPSNAYIENHGFEDMHVSSVKVSGVNGFTFAGGSSSPAGEGQVALEFGVEGDMVDAAACLGKATLENTDAWTIPAKGILPLRFSGAVSELRQAPSAELQFGFIQWFVESDVVEPNAGEAYAVLDESGKFTLFRSKETYANDTEQTAKDIMGNVYHGRVYSGVENTGSRFDMAPWRGQCMQVTSVEVADGQEIAPASTAGWFYGCRNLESCDLGGLDGSRIKNMTWMFGDCVSLASVDLSMLDTSNVEVAVGLFYGCASLASLSLSGFDMGKLTDMNGMFHGCSSLTSLDLSGFDTSNVENFGSLVKGCTNLESIDISGFDTHSATSTNCMFRECYKLESIDMRGCDMSNVTNAYGMFIDCRSLKTIYADADADWSSYFPEDSKNMFWRCLELTGGAGTAYSKLPNNVVTNGRNYARIDGLDGKPGFFTCSSG